MKGILKIICIVVFLTAIFLACQCTFAANVMEDSDKIFEPWEPLPPVTPPENKHPRVLFTDEDIPLIRENLTKGENVYAFENLREYAIRDFSKMTTVPKAWSEDNLNIIEAQAFYYAVCKDDEVFGKEALSAGEKAISGIDVIKNMNVGSVSDICRRWGRKMNVLAEVYDWCYELLSDTQKTEICELFREYGQHMEMWVAPLNEDKKNGAPSGQSSITGHGSEAQLLKDMLSFAISVYDERPDIWNYVGGRYYDEYVPARKFWSASHYTHQGTNYGFYRQTFDLYAFMLIRGMGAKEPYSSENISKTGYSEIYMRRPDGVYFADGDIYSSTTPPFSYNTNYADNMLLAYSLTNDAYLKGELLKRCFEQTGTELEFNNNASLVLFLIFNNPDIQAKNLYELSQSNYFPSPVGMMTARTSWDEGENSSAVSAVMKIGEYAFNNHQHLDHGSFQIYYKGILASESGNYNTYWDTEHSLYTRKTVAHNCMLVFDPDEYVQLPGAPSIDYRWSHSANKYILRSDHTNDGGQSAKYNYAEPANMDIYNANDMKMAAVLAREIDPKNSERPNYTYIKGDLTNSYTHKVSDYNRSFMFLDLKNVEIPAALIVFDEITSSDEKFRKTWLLHGTQRPEINGNTAVFENTADANFGSYGGRLELTTLLPKYEDFSAEIIGGNEQGWGVVRRWKYDDKAEDWKMTFEGSYDEVNAKDGDENNTYRIEITPRIPKNKDYFFNCMLISDAGEPTKIKAELIETESFFGTTVLDRAVFFAAEGENNTFFNATLSGEFKYTVCDMKPGSYVVTDSNGMKTVCVSDEGHVLSFEACGAVTAEWISDGYLVPEDNKYVANSKPNFKVGNIFLSNRDLLVKNGLDFEVDVQTFADALGYLVKADETKCVISNGTKKVATIFPFSARIVTPRGVITSQREIIFEDGRYYMTVSDLSSALCGNGSYQSFSDTIYMNANSSVRDYYSEIFKTNHTVGIYAGQGECYNVSVLIPHSGDIDLYCGLFDGNRLVECRKLTEYGDGYYTEVFPVSLVKNIENPVFKVFPWGDDILPVGNTVKFKELIQNFETCGYKKLYTYAGGSLKTGGSAIEVTTIGDSFRITKNTQKYDEANVAFNIYDTRRYYLEKNSEILHQSAYVKHVANGDAAEGFQFRLRLNGDDGTSNSYSVLLDNTPGNSYRVDSIIDLENQMFYLYIDGELYNTRDLKSWTVAHGAVYVPTFHFYIVSSAGNMGGCFEVYEPRTAVYSRGTSAEEIMSYVGNTIFK